MGDIMSESRATSSRNARATSSESASRVPNALGSIFQVLPKVPMASSRDLSF